MGIGNLRGRHGDARRGRCSSLPLMGIGNRPRKRNGRCVVCGLITPHGDRKPETRQINAIICRYSLPLMGIGNPVCAAAWRAPGRSSLPLMGIGNTKARTSATRTPSRLITPHGDRKLGVRRRARAGNEPLITPHGDRKPAGRRFSHNPELKAHYPSWGSETPVAQLGHHRPVAELITPHGDRKHRRGNRQRRVGQAHYPSWGSETRFRRLSA